ncbi:hypothetical protein GQ53DRAFT_823466 [Thozetella sp. PMI_491]|nr:hypothetical protein GQ53DRAFT_823466 [Thozetella sp. PMI_491]
MDPLSVSASVITALDAVKKLYDFMNDIKDAPETLAKAAANLKETESVLEGLRRYLEGSPETPPTVQTLVDQKSAFGSVVSYCERLCSDFRKQLDKCVGPLDKDGKMRWINRLVTAASKRRIEHFPTDISRTLELISLRAEMINLLTSEQTIKSVRNFQQKNEAAMGNIIQQLGFLGIKMKHLQEMADQDHEGMEDMLKSQEAILRDQETMLKKQLLLCEENSAAESHVHIKQDFGNTSVGEYALNVQGLDLDKVKGSFEQKYGGTSIGYGGISVQGAFGEAVPLKALEVPRSSGVPSQAESSSRSHSFTGQGRKLGSNVFTFDDLGKQANP